MPHVRPSIADKRRAFHRLHQDGCFVIPNPWDVGSARYLQTLGFKALAPTSSGFAWSHGHRDGAMSRDRVLDHLTEMVEATDLPINADFEPGFAPDAPGVADSVRLAVETGVAGLSIEDSTGDASKPLFDFDTAVDRIRAARKAIDKAGSDTMLIGRAWISPTLSKPSPDSRATRMPGLIACTRLEFAAWMRSPRSSRRLRRNRSIS